MVTSDLKYNFHSSIHSKSTASANEWSYLQAFANEKSFHILTRVLYDLIELVSEPG